MSNEDPARTRLRIGGWLPSYDGVPRIPGPRPARHHSAGPAPLATGSTLDTLDIPTHTRRSRRRTILASGALMTALVLPAVASLQEGVAPATVAPVTAGPATGAARGTAVLGQAPAAPSAPATSPPASASADGGAAGLAAGDRREAASRDNRTGTGTASIPPKKESTPAPAFVMGARVGLEPLSAPGYRVRHRNFAGRIDHIGPYSGALDRADSSFTVRAGLANSGCVSLEAVNYPGYYLRHQNFRIYLHRIDGTRLFAADATFCAVTGLTGQGTSLRSYNYPDRYLCHRSSDLFISAGVSTTATFAVRDAL